MTTDMVPATYGPQMEYTLAWISAFPGFYDSWLSREIDHEEEMLCEHETERQGEHGDEPHPEHLRLEQGDFAEFLFDCIDYSAVHHAAAQTFAEGFNHFAGQYLEFDPGFRFESMSSPREYNFETDRLFVDVPLTTITRLFRISEQDGHAALARVLKDRFTSYDGFHSHYSNELGDWLEKPVEDWDHNEIGTLIEAAIIAKDPDAADDWEGLFYATCEDSAMYYALDKGLDYKTFQAKVQERRDELQEEYDEEHADDPHHIPPYRCSETPDMFM